MSLNVALVNYKKDLQNDMKDCSANDPIACRSNKDKNINSMKMSVIIENGSTLIELSKTANILFGKILALEYLINIGMNVVGIFITLHIFKGFSTLEYALIMLSMGSFFIVIRYTLKLHSCARVGQNLCNSYNEINDGLGRLLIHDGICDKQRRELEFLVNRFSIASPIRPLDMFDMNYGHFAALNNIMFTYNIILMQFKGY